MNTINKALATLTLITVSSSIALADEELVRVGTEPSYAPFEFMDESTKELTGFDVEIIKAIAQAANFKLEIQTMPFDALIPAILTGSLDAGISAFTITDERKKRVAFSEPYIQAGLGILVRKSLVAEITKPEDLKGHKLCGQIGTSGAMYASKLPDTPLAQFNSASEAYMELRSGGCDAIVHDRPVHAYYMATVNPDDLVLIPDYVSVEEYGIVMDKRNQQLQDLINSGMSKIKADGTYQKIYNKWFAN